MSASHFVGECSSSNSTVDKKGTYGNNYEM